MPKIIPYFQEQHREFIFPVIERKLSELKTRFPAAAIVNLGIGDISLPLAPAIGKAIGLAVEEMGHASGLHGYAPTNGYPFLREAIAHHECAHLGIGADEIFISDGTCSDVTNIQELFTATNVVGILDPTYPAYFDAVLMAGKTKIVPIPCREEDNFCPLPPQEHCDLIYLCSPSNPTGIAFTRAHLAEWVAYALKERALLLFDHAYQAFITSPSVPKSIYEIEGAKECAIEFRSFSKTAGFTGLRCAYTILPKTIHALLGDKKVSLHPLWEKRQSIKHNGVSYPIQRGAEAVYTPEGQQQTRAQIAAYLKEAHHLKEGLQTLGHTCYGGTDSPYIFWKNPPGMTSWGFFDHLLEECHLLSIPGRGFGAQGEGFVRLSAFTTPDKTQLALERIKKI